MKNKIGFIGTGVMGASIVKHLLKAGKEVTIYTRTKSKATELFELGAIWAETPAAASVDKEVIFTMVGYPQDVLEVYTGEEGILKSATKGTIIVDMTTSEPTLAVEIYKLAKEKEIHSIDAPVSGGDIGARNGTLSIMVGGDLATFEDVLPILNIFGANVVYQGSAGAGQHTKMCNQIAIASNMIGVCESMAYGLKAGLNLEDVLKSISSGAASSWSLSSLAPRMIEGDYEPGFYIKHILKDIEIAIAEAERMQLNLPGLNLAKDLYNTLIEQGYAEKGTQALIKYYV